MTKNLEDHLSLGYMLEGILRKTKGGNWFIERYDGSLEPLEDALDKYKNKEVRLTMVNLQEADHLQHLLERGLDDDHESEE